ncbi:hypothetical protein FXO37_22180 [Capsicum annuum]|nr:hypothetical protein FXO37_22180 [Capsicum annuum]
MCLCGTACLESGVYRKQPFYFFRGRGMDCVHPTPPDPTRWEYTGFVVVVVVATIPNDTRQSKNTRKQTPKQSTSSRNYGPLLVTPLGFKNTMTYQPPSLSAVVNNNNVVGEYVEREKRTPKENSYYKNAAFVLKKDGLPSEINRKLKTKGGGKKDSGVSNHGFAFDDNYRKQLYRSCPEQAFEVEFGPRSILCRRKERTTSYYHL